MMSLQNFVLARATIEDFTRYGSYDDWQDKQEGIQVGYLMSGVDAILINLDFIAFKLWCTSSGFEPNEKALARYAIHFYKYTGGQPDDDIAANPHHELPY